jgi:hypothetical protein
MLGGYNVPPLIELLSLPETAAAAADSLSRTLFIFDAFDEVLALSQAGNAAAERVLRSWAEAEWFTSRPAVPAEIKATVFKVDGEIDFCPGASFEGGSRNTVLQDLDGDGRDDCFAPVTTTTQPEPEPDPEPDNDNGGGGGGD